MTAAEDAHYMAYALQLARRGLYTADPNPRVGCVLVKRGQIIAEGWHRKAGEAHAEIVALAQTQYAAGATAYVSLEPCSHYGRTGPCCDALIAAGIVRVVAAMQDPNPQVAGNGIKRLQAAGIDVCVGVLQTDAERLNQGFIKRMTTGLPFIRSKLAMSLDGRTAMASGESQWITSPQSRQDVQHWRAQSSAILTGIDTVLADDPQLTARVDAEMMSPVRVVLDSNLSMPLSAKLLKFGGETWIMTACEDRAKIAPLEALGAKVFVVKHQARRLDLVDVFTGLGTQQINTVWVEAGATLNGALLESGVVDEWFIYMATCVLGDQAKGLFHLPYLMRLSDKKSLHLSEVRQIGMDLRMRFNQVRSSNS